MQVTHLSRLLLDSTPRQLFHYLQRRLYKQVPRTGFDPAHPAIFVLSTGRAGTETVAALLNLVPALAAYHEPSPLLYGLGQVAYRYESQPSSQPILEEAYLTARRDLFAYALKTGRGYAETSPQSTFLASAIYGALPSARFIHLVRDPREVVRSAMRRQWYGGNPHDATRLMPLPGTESHAAWSSFLPFQKNLWLWQETNRWILTWRQSLPADQTLLLRAESLFKADPTALDQLYTFSCADPPSREEIRRVLGKQLNAQQEGTFPRFDEWSETMVLQLRSMVGETANTLGYEI